MKLMEDKSFEVNEVIRVLLSLGRSVSRKCFVIFTLGMCVFVICSILLYWRRTKSVPHNKQIES